jgi:thioredoxin-related protein
MAKILIATSDFQSFLTGNLSRQEYSFTTNKETAFCFDNDREAIEFEQEDGVADFLADTLTELMDYDSPGKSIYSTK